MTKNFNDQVGLKDENLPMAVRGLPNSEGWWIARGTTDPAPENTRLVHVEISGKFTGEVRVGGLAVRQK